MKRIKLKEISSFIGSGLTPLRSNTKYWNNATIPWLKTEQLGEYKIYNTNEFISEIALKETSIKLYPVNTIAIAMYGEGQTRGKTSIIKKPMTTNQACCNLIINEQKADYLFVYYNLRTKYNKLRSLSSGVRKNLNSNDIKDLEIELPENISTQQKIAKVLSALDDKIELNNRINAELEAMAKTLYDYWFVQFDFPNENNKPYKTSGGKMTYSPELKREIPVGWEVKKLGELGVFKNGINYDPTKPGNTFANIINVRNISNSSTFISKFDLDKIALFDHELSNYLVSENDILIARSGIPGAIRLISEFDENTIYCGFIIRFLLSDNNFKNYLFFTLRNLESSSTAKSTGTIMQNINQDTLKRMDIIIPNSTILNKFNSVIVPIFTKLNINIKENQQLSELRDWLLPMLMNGQVKVGGDE
jgi:type I restriction enzyme S subunit